MQHLRILHQDEFLVVFEKPAGLSVHPSEKAIQRGEKRKGVDVIRILRSQLGRPVYPVHRLDRATQGVMVMAFEGRIAGLLQAQFKSGEVEKGYLLMCRGWTPLDGRIDSPLSSDPDQEDVVLQDATTEFCTLSRFELPIPFAGFQTSRFSLVKASPKTGRFHQIRRHFKRISHPLIGDSMHGDGKQNRIWRELLGESRLYLMAWTLKFRHPMTHQKHTFRARFAKAWHPVFDRAGVCPFDFLVQET
jgi:tRNA pseudouridine65 synthase